MPVRMSGPSCTVASIFGVMMKTDYICPHCRAELNPRDEIVMLLSWDGAKHLVLFSSRIGDYTVHTPKGVAFDEGEVVEFMCPACHESLNSPAADDLGEIFLRKSDGSLARVGFSRTYGKHATFLVDEEDVKGFGDDVTAYQETNWFGAGRLGDEDSF